MRLTAYSNGQRPTANGQQPRRGLGKRPTATPGGMGGVRAKLTLPGWPLAPAGKLLLIYPGTTPPAPRGAAGGPAARLASPLFSSATTPPDAPRELATGRPSSLVGLLSSPPDAIASRYPAGSRPDSRSVTGQRLSRRIGRSGHGFCPATARMAHGGTLRAPPERSASSALAAPLPLAPARTFAARQVVTGGAL